MLTVGRQIWEESQTAQHTLRVEQQFILHHSPPL